MMNPMNPCHSLLRALVLVGPLALAACAGSPDASAVGSAGSSDESALTSSEYGRTKYPIVLAHGMAGFDSLFGVYDYWYGIESTLRDAGATVYVTHVPAFDSSEARGEALLAEVEDIVERTGAAKVNLIGHSHGGFDVRYVAAVRPDLVASVTTIGSPHKGADLADFLRAHLENGGLPESVLALFADELGTILGLLSGHTSPQDAVAGLDALTSDGAAAFNAKYPAGLPATSCGEGPAEANGIRFFSWTGTRAVTNVLDVSDAALKLSSQVYSGANDGLVGRCSAHFGKVLRDDYDMNHLDEVNQVIGLTAIFATDPKTVFRTHANRLKNAGL